MTIRQRFEEEKKKNSYYVQDNIETPVSTIQYVEWLEKEAEKDPYIHDLEQTIELDEIRIKELESIIKEMANAAAAVLRVAKKNPIEGNNFVKFIQRMEYLQELVEKERGNIAPEEKQTDLTKGETE